MSQQSTIVTFRMTCPEPRAWLVLISDTQKPRVVEMRQQNPSVWTACAELIPGEYRCRYYCGDDRNVIYCGPANIEGSIEHGMDALVSVKIPEVRNAPRFVREQTDAVALLMPPSGTISDAIFLSNDGRANGSSGNRYPAATGQRGRSRAEMDGLGYG